MELPPVANIARGVDIGLRIVYVWCLYYGIYI